MEHEQDDGHIHIFEYADIDTGTDCEAVICTLCGMLSVKEPKYTEEE